MKCSFCSLISVALTLLKLSFVTLDNQFSSSYKALSIMNGFFIFPLIIVVVSGSPTLELYAAGMKGKFIKTLQDGDKICPQDFTRGFSIKCVSAGSRWAQFFVNGRLEKRDGISPFFISGRGKRFVKAWNGYPDIGNEFSVTCYSNLGIVRMSLTISCDGSTDCTYESEKASDPAGTLYFKEASNPSATKIKLISGGSFCPNDVFSSAELTIEAKGDTSEMAYFFVDGKLEYIARSDPFYIAGGSKDSPNPWNYHNDKSYKFDIFLPSSKIYKSVNNVVISCASSCKKGNTPSPKISDSPKPNPKVTNTPKPSPTSRTSPAPKLPAGCIVIDAKRAVLSTGWSLLTDGIGYRVNDPSMTTSDAGLAPIQYEFKVPSSSYYSVILEFTTNNTFYFNDLWIKMNEPGLGLNLYRNTIVTKDWVKVYHNEFGRAALTWTQRSAFVKRSISSGKKLNSNVGYILSVSGRSAQVILHRILLFPCQKTLVVNQCQYQKWKENQNRCIPDSYVSGA